MDTLWLGFVHDPDLDRYVSKSVPVPMCNGEGCRIILADYHPEADERAFRAAIVHFLAADPSVLTAAEPHIYAYYQDSNAIWEPGDDEYLAIDEPRRVWRHVRLGHEAVVSRRPAGDRGVYVSLECECDWAPEHGLQLVFRDGRELVKVGPCDGHLTHADAYDDERLEGVIYGSPSEGPVRAR
jgi:hypothetical protein